MTKQKMKLTWDEVLARLRKWEDRLFSSMANDDGVRVFGVPRGGMILTAFLTRGKAVPHPGQAHLILDDIADSGRTRRRYQQEYPNIPFHVLYDKEGDCDDANLGWLVFPWERDDTNNNEDSAEDSVIRQLQYIGEDVTREGLKETPVRVVKTWKELFSGYNLDPSKVLKTFSEGVCDLNEMILLKGIEFYSTCEHHLLPFFGKAHIAYIPNGKVVGISKLARVLDIYASRAQLQERIGDQVTSTLMQHLQPLGAACIIEAQHFCMKSRGVRKQDSIMVTSSLKGVFLSKPEARAELMTLIKT